MSAERVSDDGPVPLHLPSILHNPANHALRQVEAHNAQQRERLLARKTARGVDRNAPSSSSLAKGKRVIRRHDNATFSGNPHIAQPRRGDYYPPVPLHSKPSGPSFPPSTLARSERVQDVILPPKDPLSGSSVNGGFHTSLKGVRGMLRKRGRRAERLVGVVEKSVREWLEAPMWSFASTHPGDDDDEDEGSWKVIDSHLVPVGTSDVEGPSIPGRRLPPQHQVTTVPPIPRVVESAAAVLELSRSPAHLTWHVTDSFERLVVHLLARYYDLISWSEDHPTLDGSHLRLTHIIQPSLLRPRPTQASSSLITPETTDISDHSSSDRDSARGSSTDASPRGHRGSDSESEMDTETETERGSVVGIDDQDSIEGYSLEPHPGDQTITGLETPSFEEAMAELDLRDGEIGADGAPLMRVQSSDSSMYASSEGGSEWSALGDSLTLPAQNGGGGGGGGGMEGWSSVLPSAAPTGPLGSRPRVAVSNGNGTWKKGKVEKPTFFEYLYGA